ncbi:MAG: ATP-binding protein [Nitriliruptorales bacterium]
MPRLLVGPSLPSSPMVARRSLRSRILVGYVLLLISATTLWVLLTRVLLLERLNARLSSHLEQEVEELRQLAAGVDPATGRPFGGDVRRIFTVFLQRNIPLPYETMLTLVDGQPFLRSTQTVEHRLDTDPELVGLWGSVTEPLRSRAYTPAGEVDYLAVPVLGAGEVRGVFVVAAFRAVELADVNRVVRITSVVGLLTVIAGSVVAWRLSDRILRPVRGLITTARSITETDLSRRIEVGGDDEVAELAATLNAMLDRLEEAFETQRRFVDDAGHEFKTPITAIRGQLEVLDEDPDERRQTIALVLDELDRMARMVSDLLLLARSERPDFLTLGPVDVSGLVRDVHAKATGLGDRAWRLEDDASGTIQADRQRLTQALLQLAANAVQHSEDGSAVAIGGSVLDGEARLWVRDEGEGIPPEEQARIFERFHRGEGGSRIHGGAGLGLSIVAAIAEAHGGRVELRSRPGAGATFTLVIPARQA